MRSLLLVLFAAGALLSLSLVDGSTASPNPENVPPPGMILPRTGQVLTYDQQGAVVDFSGTGQDGEFQRGQVWPEPRFVVNGDGTISDALTGVMWLAAGNCFGDLPWPAAQRTLSDFNQGKISCPGVKAKYDDWFLPDLANMISLVDAQAAAGIGSTLRLAGFSETQNGTYWTSTPHRNQQNVWSVEFANGTVAPVNKLERHFMLVARQPGSDKGQRAQGDSGQPPSTGKTTPMAGTVSARFLDNLDGSITDSKTGLIWVQDAACLPVLDWQGALSLAKELGEGGGVADCPSLRGGGQQWSLPNVVELRSLIDYETDYPALPPGHPFQRVVSSGYWTATTVASAPDQAFAVDLETGVTLAVRKSEKRRVLVVRLRAPVPDRPRKAAEGGVSLSVDPRYVLAAAPELISEIKWPPGGRFINNGDGTSLDIITGINWLTDANCLGKKSWKEGLDAVLRFNAQSTASVAQDRKKTQGTRKSDIKCEGYEGSADDWVMPTLAELMELTNGEEQDSAAWLNRQGLNNVQSSAIYWTGTETPLNLYFADAVTIKTGKAGVYPKSLKFNVWPHRKVLAEAGKAVEPLLNLTANTIGNYLTVTPNDPLSLAVYLHTFGLRMSADFWFWYDTPDEKRLWLTSNRSWTDTARPLYQGPLFNLVNYEIFRSAVNGLPPGVYDFHFAVDANPNGWMDDSRTEVTMSVVVPGGGQ